MNGSFHYTPGLLFGINFIVEDDDRACLLIVVGEVPLQIEYPVSLFT